MGLWAEPFPCLLGRFACRRHRRSLSCTLLHPFPHHPYHQHRHFNTSVPHVMSPWSIEQKEIEFLTAENKRLATEVEQAKKDLVAAEVRNGRSKCWRVRVPCAPRTSRSPCSIPHTHARTRCAR